VPTTLAIQKLEVQDVSGKWGDKEKPYYDQIGKNILGGYLIKDRAEAAEIIVKKYIKAPVTQDMYNALVSRAYYQSTSLHERSRI